MMEALLVTLALAQDFGLNPHAFQHPIDYAYVGDNGDDAVFSITHGEDVPTRVCISLYSGEDTDFLHPTEERCFIPEPNTFLTLYRWEGRHVASMAGIMVKVYHQHTPTTVMVLTNKET